MADWAVRTAFLASDKVSPAFKQMAMSADNFSKKTTSIFSGIAGAMGVFGGFALAAMGMKKVVSEAANFENSVASFTTLLEGSQSEAEKLVKTLQKIGAETPFEFKDLSDATVRLLGFGVVTKDTAAGTLKMLGDLAQGSAERLQGISLVYGQIMAGGKMMGQDFNQLINQQVPIAKGLAKVWNVDVDQAIKRIKQNGPVAAKDVQKAMQLMTSEGGMFYKGMERASKTLTGRWSTFKDAISMTAAGIGTVLLPALKDMVDYAIIGSEKLLKVVQNNKEFINILFKSIPIIIGLLVAWKVATWGVIIAKKAMNLVGWIQYLWMMRDAIGAAVVRTNAWAVAQRVINFLLSMNPIGLVIIAVGTLVYAIHDLYTNWEVYALRFNIWIQDFITGFRYMKMEVYELLNLLGLITDKELTGAKLGYLQSFSEGNKMKLDLIQKQKQAPNAAEAEGKYNNNIGITVNNNGTQSSVETTPRGIAKADLVNAGVNI